MNIQHFVKNLAKNAKDEKSNGYSMHFDHESSVINPSREVTNKKRLNNTLKHNPFLLNNIIKF